MISKPRTLMLGLICSTVLFLSDALAMDGGMLPPGHPGSGGPLMGAIRDLGLSQSQEAEMRTILAKYKEELKTYMNTVFDLKNEMTQTLMAQEYDETWVKEYIQTISANIEALELLKAKMLVEIKSGLYPEQIEQLQKNLAEKHTLMEKQREQRDTMMEKLMEQTAE